MPKATKLSANHPALPTRDPCTPGFVEATTNHSGWRTTRWSSRQNMRIPAPKPTDPNGQHRGRRGGGRSKLIPTETSTSPSVPRSVRTTMDQRSPAPKPEKTTPGIWHCAATVGYQKWPYPVATRMDPGGTFLGQMSSCPGAACYGETGRTLSNCDRRLKAPTPFAVHLKRGLKLWPKVKKLGRIWMGTQWITST